MYDSQSIANRIKEIAKSKNVSLKTMLSDCDLGINLISHLAKGQAITYTNLAKIADYLDCSVDYLLGRTDSPTSNTSRDIVDEIPLSYIEQAGGDLKKARALMLAAERDKQRAAAQKSGKSEQFSPADAQLIFALWGDTEDIDEKDLEDVKRFAAFIKERKQNK